MLSRLAFGSFVLAAHPIAVPAQASRATETPAPLTREAAARALDATYESRLEQIRKGRATEFEAREVRLGDHRLRFESHEFGAAPFGQRNLWISLHGGGGTTAATNDRQWRNQVDLYRPEQGIYVAPRAPTNTWDLWHQSHIDALLDRLIETFVAIRGVDPDRVYLMGYSAGGDGVFQLAPRMADRFAAASMMAGHPNETQPHGLRNLPFAIYMGGKNTAYRRNEIAAQWRVQLADLRRDDAAGGYPHQVTIYPECGHWMDRQDAAALPWMANHTREAWPKKIVWRQDDVLHRRFYWLEFEPAVPLDAGDTVVARVDGQDLYLESEHVSKVTLRLHDRLLDLDATIHVYANGQEVWTGIVRRSQECITQSLATRLDPSLTATATLRIEW